MDAQQFLAEFRHIANAQGGIAHLRTMIYQLAVTGSLTPRGDIAEDAGQLLANISEKRQSLIHAKQYKRMLELESEPVLPPQSIALPATWRWTRLLDIGEINPRNDAPDNKLAAFVPMSGVPQYHRAGIVAETKRWGDIKKGYTHFANGDVVLAKITPCFENGKAAVVEDLPGDAGIGAGTTELHVFRPIHTGILPAYVYLFLRSPLFTVEGERSMTGTAGQKRLPTDYFATRAFPLPPSKEQARIVAKVDELMVLCDQLEQQQLHRRRLQDALRLSILQAVASDQSSHELQASWQRLQASFGLLFSDPADLDELQGLVRDLAIRGLLIEHDIAAQRPGVDLHKLQMASDALRGLKSIRSSRRVGLPGDFKEPFSIPDGWKWISLDQACYQITDGAHHTPRYTAAGIPFLSVKDISGGVIDFSSTRFISETTHDQLTKRCKPQRGDVLLTKVGTTGIATTVDTDAPFSIFVSIALLKFSHEFVSPDFLELLISSPFVKKQSEDGTRGIGNKNLVLKTIKGFAVPLPPLSDQLETLKISQHLLDLCKSLRDQLQNKVDLADRLASVSIAALAGIAIEQDEEVAMKAPKTQLIAPLRLGKAPNARTEAPLARELARHNGAMSASDLWQRFGGEIDAFYAQLKHEVAQGWIQEPTQADVQVVEA